MIFAKVPPRQSNSGGRPASSPSTLSPLPAGPRAPANGGHAALWNGSLFLPRNASATTPPVCSGCVPDGLASLNQWIVWRRAKRRDTSGRETFIKMPVSARTLHAASSTDPATWASLRLAQSVLTMPGEFAGLGFVFAGNGSLFGIDLDNCISADGEVAPWACDILAAFPTYAEVSPSGNGIKIFGIGEHHTKGSTAWMGPPIAGQKRPRVEVYGWGRYFAFTGRRWPDAPPQLGDCRTPLVALVERLKPKPILDRKPRLTPNSPAAALAAKYLLRVPPTQCGTANCHNRTFFAACRLSLWFGLGVGEAMPLLAEWAARGTHKWTERELQHKLADAARKAVAG